MPEERCWGAQSLFVIETSRDHHDCCDTPSEAIPPLNGFHDLPGVRFLCLDHSLTLMGLRYRLYKQQTPQNSSASPRSRNPQTTRIKVHRPKKQEKEKAWWNEETYRTQDRCKSMMGDALLPLMEFQNRIPKCHWGCSWKQLRVCFLPPFPSQTDYMPTEWQLESKGRAGSCSAKQTT